MNIIMISTSGLDVDPRVYNEALTLINAGHTVEVLSWDREQTSDGKEYTEIDGIKIKRFFPKSQFGTGFKQIIPFLRYISEVRNYLKSCKFDVVHGQDIDGAFIGTLVKKNKKLVWDMRELYDCFNHGRFKSFLYEGFARWCFLNINGLITAIDYQIERYNPKIKINTVCETILNTPEETIFEGFCRKKSDSLRIAYIGSVRQFDELKLLMDAGSLFNNVQIKIHGSGPVLSNLKSIKNISSNVEMTGQFNYKDTKNLYEETDILYVVYDKNKENQKYGIPIKGYEAIYTATPVITGDGTYFAEFVKENDIGFVISGESKNELINLVTKIIKNKTVLEDKIKNLKKIQFLYSWNKQADKLKKFYQLIDEL
jgi:glycosyltransferase involved in cell wall biosynthesis